MPALIKTTTSSSSSDLPTSQTIGNSKTVNWHAHTTTGTPWTDIPSFPNFSFQPSAKGTGQSPPKSSMTMPAHTAPSRLHYRPGHHHFEYPPHLPPSSARSTASLVVDLISEIFPLVRPWTPGATGTTNDILAALDDIKGVSLLTAHELGGHDEHPEHCSTSMLAAVSCILRDVVDAEDALTNNSAIRLTRSMKRLEMHQRDLLGFLRGNDHPRPTRMATNVPVSAPVMSNSGIPLTSDTMAGCSTLTLSTQSVLVGPPLSIGADTSLTNPTSSSATSAPAVSASVTSGTANTSRIKATKASTKAKHTHIDTKIHTHATNTAESGTTLTKVHKHSTTDTTGSRHSTRGKTSPSGLASGSPTLASGTAFSGSLTVDASSAASIIPCIDSISSRTLSNLNTSPTQPSKATKDTGNIPTVTVVTTTYTNSNTQTAYKTIQRTITA